MKKNWLTFSNVVVLVSFMLYQAKWQERVDSQISSLQIEVAKHTSDKDAHRPLGTSIQLFVPRTELDGRLESIMRTLEKIDKKL